jgi:hypothetical protein
VNLAVSVDWGQYKTILEIISYAIYLVGIPVGLLEALRKQRQRLDIEEQKVYTEVNDKYIDFLKLALEYPHLHVSDFSPADAGTGLPPEQQIQQFIMYDMLTSIFERAFLLYDVDKGAKSDEWPGWDRWIENYVKKLSYQAYMRKHIQENNCFGDAFQAYLLRKLATV